MLVTQDTFDSLYKNSIEFKIQNSSWRAPCAKHLIAMKFHAINNNSERLSRDIADVHEIYCRTDGVVSKKEILELCEIYGMKKFRTP